MASFELSNVKFNGVTFTVYPSPEFDFYYLYVRLASDTQDTSFGRWVSLDPYGGPRSFEATGLQPGQAYRANVACSRQEDLWGATWLTGVDFSTPEAPQGTAEINISRDPRYPNWVWVQAEVWTGSTWEPLAQEINISADPRYPNWVT